MKIPATEIKMRREKMNLSIKEICKFFKLETATWERWEREDTAPYFFNFALLYLENNPQIIVQKKPVLNQNVSDKQMIHRVVGSPRERFLAKIMIDSDSDCWIWRGGKNFGITSDKTLTPRKAAWYIEHGIIPENDIKITCGNNRCVYIQHLELGRPRSNVREQVSTATKAAIILELQKKTHIKELVKKYNVSLGTISAIKTEVETAHNH